MNTKRSTTHARVPVGRGYGDADPRARVIARSLALALGLLPVSVPFASTAAAAPGTAVDLRVLVVSTGTPAEDAGLDLMDDLLEELGVPYDVLNSATTELSEAMLRAGDHGFYNGVIITNAETYIYATGTVGLDTSEWNILHQYERDFGVRESVIAGFPTSGGTPNYGLTPVRYTSLATEPLPVAWTADADAGVYSYVNAGAGFAVNDFAISAVARNLDGDPVVTPYLVERDNPANALVSHLAYPDGREVLFSTVANTWFLKYSQVLAYGLLDFATSGLHLGTRKVYLGAHLDDLFLAADLWDPVQNVTDETLTYRNTDEDITGAVAAQEALLSRFPTLPEFKLDFAFNGWGAIRYAGYEDGESSAAGSTTTNATLVADTFIFSYQPNATYVNNAAIQLRWANSRVKQGLIDFDLPAGVSTIEAATLTLQVDSNNGRVSNFDICRVTEPWNPAKVTWQHTDKALATAWSTGGGAAYDAASCLSQTINSDAAYSFDVTSLVQAWLGGAPEYGLVLVSRSGSAVNFASQQTATPPSLSLQVPAQTTTDALVSAVQQNADKFRWLNHTYTHYDMGVANGTTAAQAIEEVSLNHQVWRELGLPEYDENLSVLVTGMHSGLENNNGTPSDTSDDVAYPEGRNVDAIAGMASIGVRYLASDTSRVGMNVEQLVPGTDIVLLPRWPTSIFFNALDPDQLVDEYNYIFHERYLAAGQDPCQIAGALCAPRSYAEILAADADVALRHMLTYKRFPHYFHVGNIAAYDGAGSTLMFDWLTAVMTAYEQYLDLPVENPPYWQIADETRKRLLAAAANVSGTLDLTSGQVSLSADSSVEITVTGLQGGTAYGDQLHSRLTVGVTPTVVAKSN